MRPVSGSFFGGALKATLRPTSRRSGTAEPRLFTDTLPVRKDPELFAGTVAEPREGAAEPRVLPPATDD